jgi:hypothetical protein
MMSIRSLADFNRSSLGGDGDWLTPPPSPPRPHEPGRHDERGTGTFNWPPARTSTWPYTGTFSWPRTSVASYKRGAGGSNPPAPLTGCRRVRLERHLRRRWCLSQECPRRRAGLEAVGGTAVRVSICEVRAWRTVPAQPAMPGLAGQPHYVLWAAAARSPVLRPPAPRARAPGPLDPGRGTALCSQRRAALTDPISGQSDPVHTGMRAWLLRSLRPDRVLELDSYRRG